MAFLPVGPVVVPGPAAEMVRPDAAVLAEEWLRPYSRELAALPAPWVREAKFWPAVARLDNALGETQPGLQLSACGGLHARGVRNG